MTYYIWRTVGQSKRYRLTWKKWLIFGGISYGLPLIFSTILLSVGAIRDIDQGICYPIEPYHIILWFSPLVTAWLSILIFYILIQRLLSQQRRSTMWHAIVTKGTHSMPVHYRVSLYALVFLICWSFDIFSWIYSRWVATECPNHILTSIYGILLNLQAFLDSLVYGLTNRQLREKCRESPIKFVILFIGSPLFLYPAACYRLYSEILKRHAPMEMRPFNSSGSSRSISSSQSSSQSLHEKIVLVYE
eukprot:TRINITY_DN1793_c0_g1_i2.p1 TRINITY_DN1793_c0_g1~~TRINITY_DN1793_c0_g1_i2.p1  ORF type:complete len:247 (+),score=11.48 TRINITY_DN1793_c0_g1_i2:358-1098(+)